MFIIVQANRHFVYSLYKQFGPFEDLTATDHSTTQTQSVIESPLYCYNKRKRQVKTPVATRYRVKMRSKPSRTFRRRQIRNSILILRSIFGHSDAVHRSSSKSEKNGMLRHSFDRAVMFFSLQHCIFTALTQRLCLHFPNLKLLPACPPDVGGRH